MQISIIAVGKLKESYLKEGMAEYIKRLAPFAKVKIMEVNEEKGPSCPSPSQIEAIKKAEGKRLLGIIPPRSYHIALALDGENLSSLGLAAKIEEAALGGNSHLVFSIGGSWGLDNELLKKADFLLSFGKMTFPHQLMRLILMEQIYRSFKINRGGEYHK